MARQTHTALTALGPKDADYSAGAADVAMTAADVANYEEVAHSGAMLIVAHNEDTGACTVTIEGAADSFGRSADIETYSLAAEDRAVFGPFFNEGWRQSDGMLYFRASDANVKLGAISLGTYL